MPTRKPFAIRVLFGCLTALLVLGAGASVFVVNWYQTGKDKVFFLFPHFEKNRVVEWTESGRTVEWERRGYRIERVSYRAGYWISVDGKEVEVPPAKGRYVFYRFTGVRRAPLVAQDVDQAKQVYIVGQGWKPLGSGSFGLVPVGNLLGNVTETGIEVPGRIIRWSKGPHEPREFLFSEKGQAVAIVSDREVGIYGMNGVRKRLLKTESVQAIASDRSTGSFALIDGGGDLMFEDGTQRTCVAEENNVSSLEMEWCLFPDLKAAAYLGSFHRAEACTYP